jgi:hypothetical protein
MLFIWIFSLSMWTIITCSIGLVEYDTAINFKPLYLQTIFNIFPWFTLLIAILAVAIAIYVLLLQKAQKSKKILKKDKIEKQGTNTFTLNSTNLTGSVVTLYTNSVISKKINALKKFHLKPSQKYFIIMGSYWIQW